jgi:hypothetical protein
LGEVCAILMRRGGHFGRFSPTLRYSTARTMSQEQHASDVEAQHAAEVEDDAPESSAGWTVQDGVLIKDDRRYELKELFRGWNAHSGQTGHMNSIPYLTRMTPEEEEQNTWLASLDRATLRSVLLKCIPKGGPIEPPRRLQLPEKWARLQFERVVTEGGPDDLRAHRRVAMCWGLLANASRCHLPATKSVVGWVGLKAHEGRPKSLLRVSAWTIRRVFGLNTVLHSPVWKTQLRMVPPWTNEEGRAVGSGEIAVVARFVDGASPRTCVCMQAVAIAWGGPDGLEKDLHAVAEELVSKTGDLRGK